MSAADASHEWTVNAAEASGRARPWVVLWRTRELIAFFALRDLRVRYRQAVLGVAWVLLQPIATVAIFTLVFDRLAGIDSQGVPYPLFALTGLVAWTYFASAVTRASDVLVNNAPLVTKVHFPRLAAHAAALLPPAVDMGVALVLVALLLARYRTTPTWAALTLPLWLAALVLTAFGVALWLSALNVRYRDVQHAVPPLMQIWFFASPVAYPGSLLSGWQEVLYSLNPMAGLIAWGRWALLGTPWPGWSLAPGLAVSAIVLVSGVLHFRRAERSFADVI